MVTWPMTSRDPDRCREAVRSAILATAWLLVNMAIVRYLEFPYFESFTFLHYYGILHLRTKFHENRTVRLPTYRCPFSINKLLSTGDWLTHFVSNGQSKRLVVVVHSTQPRTGQGYWATRDIHTCFLLSPRDSKTPSPNCSNNIAEFSCSKLLLLWSSNLHSFHFKIYLK